MPKIFDGLLFGQCVKAVMEIKQSYNKLAQKKDIEKCQTKTHYTE